MRQMIDAYQIALAEGCAAAAEPVHFAHGLVEGCAYWSMTLLKDWPLAEVAANAGMRCNLLHVLKSFVELSQQTAYLETLVNIQNSGRGRSAPTPESVSKATDSLSVD